jgi:hypothetical protein
VDTGSHLKVVSTLVRTADMVLTERQDEECLLTASLSLRDCGNRLICPLQGKSNPGIELRQINPTGKSLLIFRNDVKPRNKKYFASRSTQISSLIRTVSFRQEGRIARRHETRDGMRWTRRRQASNSEPDE